MRRPVGGYARALTLCSVALLWAWEAAADDPEPAAAEVVERANAESFADLAALWDAPAAPHDRIRGGR